MFLVAVIGDNSFSYSLLEFPSQLAMDYAQDIAFRIWFFFFNQGMIFYLVIYTLGMSYLDSIRFLDLLKIFSYIFSFIFCLETLIF